MELGMETGRWRRSGFSGDTYLVSDVFVIGVREGGEGGLLGKRHPKNSGP